MKHITKISLGLASSGILTSPATIMLVKNKFQNNLISKSHHSTNNPFDLTSLKNFIFIDSNEVKKQNKKRTESNNLNIDMGQILKTIILGV